jgi:hypothetical protein
MSAPAMQGLLAGARDDHNPDLVIVPQLIQRVGQFLTRPDVQSVQLIRTVDGQDRDPVVRSIRIFSARIFSAI